ncbi:MAG: hypothetical protein JJE22_16475 [Bacteroidia bacterium]|nr:hypothetical protein [Bacteroidia bacterium]
MLSPSGYRPSIFDLQLLYKPKQKPMTIKPLFQYLVLAALSFCAVIVTLVTIYVAGQFFDLVTGYAGEISRVIQQKFLF